MKRKIASLLALALLLGTGCQEPQATPAEAMGPAPTAVQTTIPATAVPAATLRLEIAAAAPTLSPTPMPRPTDTPVPTPEPTPEPTRSPLIISAARLGSTEFDSYFDDAVFVGDSITKAFGNYVQGLRKRDEGLLGTAQFLGTISMSASTASRNQVSGDVNFRYRGRSIALTDALTAMEAKKAFIMLGVNDIGGRQWEKVEESFARLIDTIHEKCPQVEVILFGVLPVSRTYCRDHKLDITRWNSFNPILEGICRDHGAIYVSFADQVMTEDGYLATALSDGQFHLNPAGEDLWIAFLRRYAAQRLYPDAVLEDS